MRTGGNVKNETLSNLFRLPDELIGIICRSLRAQTFEPVTRTFEVSRPRCHRRLHFDLPGPAQPRGQLTSDACVLGPMHLELKRLASRSAARDRRASTFVPASHLCRDTEHVTVAGRIAPASDLPRGGPVPASCCRARAVAGADPNFWSAPTRQQPL